MNSMNNSWCRSPTIQLLWLAAASLQMVLLIGTYMIAVSALYLHQTPLEAAAITTGKIIVVAAAGLLIFILKKELISLLRHNARRMASRDSPLVVLIILGFLVYSAHQTNPQLYLGQRLLQSVLANAWQAGALISIMTLLGLATVRTKYQLMSSHPPPSMLQTAGTATCVTIVAAGLVPGLEVFNASLPLVVLSASLFLGSRFPRDSAIYLGTVTAFLSIVAILSPYRRDRLVRLLDAYSGVPDWSWKYLFAAVSEALQYAEPIGPSVVNVHVPGGADHLILAALLPHIGYLPTMLVAIFVVAVTLWSWLACFNARLHAKAYGRQVLRYIGLASASLMVINMTGALLANFGVVSVPFLFGVPFLSSRFANLMLSCMALTAASLMPSCQNWTTPSSRASWSVAMVVASALLLAVCARGIWVARYPLIDR